MSWRSITLVLLAGCAANNAATGDLELDEVRDAGRDAGKKSDASTRDAGKKSDAGRSDAGVTERGPTVCPGERPHGCYTLTDTSPEGCPEQAPEIPLGLPPLNEWDLCNNLAVGAGATCVWEGPEGGTANCLCDTGVHWLCIYL